MTSFGWAVVEAEHIHGPLRLGDTGRFGTPARQLAVDRYRELRRSLAEVIEQVQPDTVGVESPIFGASLACTPCSWT